MTEKQQHVSLIASTWHQQVWNYFSASPYVIHPRPSLDVYPCAVHNDTIVHFNHLLVESMSEIPLGELEGCSQHVAAFKFARSENKDVYA